MEVLVVAAGVLLAVAVYKMRVVMLAVLWWCIKVATAAVVFSGITLLAYSG